LEYLEYNQKSGTWFTAIELMDYFELICRYSQMVIFVRTPIYPELEECIYLFKKSGISLGYDCDDRISHVDFVNDILIDLNQPTRSEEIINNWYADAARQQKTASLVDFITTSTAYLANEMEEKFNLPTKVYPNILGKEDFCSPLCNHKNFTLKSKYVLGYMAGTPSHVNDFNVAKKGLVSFLKNHKDTLLLLRGYPVDMTGMSEVDNQIRILPFIEPENLSCAFTELDLALAPLLKSKFTDSKSNIKFLEAGALGVPTLASTSASYSEIISDRENGYLADSQNWEESLNRAYEDFCSGKNIGKVAQAKVLNSFTTFSPNLLMDSVFF
jgi:glycosyltransferase involved in cell wall biosynthesis